MFCVIEKESVEFPFCKFALFYQDIDQTKVEINGLVMGTNFCTYLFGTMDNGDSLMLISMPTITVRKKLFPALMIGTDTFGQSISSRVIFRETTETNDDEVGIGIENQENILDEIMEITNNIKNRVNIFSKSIKYKEKYVSIAQLRDIFDELLINVDVKTGDDLKFNPFDENNWEFDTAISMLNQANLD